MHAPEQKPYEWRPDPWEDGCQSTFGHAWATFRAALLCHLLGHRGISYPSEDGNRAWRTCWRCNGKWELSDNKSD
jgi:hypothetical protein